jgi:hypothetical protein
MISICIPVYNFNVTSLVHELSNQAKKMAVQYEIIIIDDCSPNFKSVNKSSCTQYKYIELSKNIGRAKIRNLFLEHAQFEYLLFLDCDSVIGNSDFLSNYISVLDEFTNVVCGGRVYDQKTPLRNRMLSWKYGVHRESQPLHIRLKTPNKSFMTNNFLIKKKLFESIKFDERITEYGHEDTLFGFALKKKNITINHIDNPVINGDIEFNDVYLKKTKEGIVNLIKILEFSTWENDLITDISLLNFHQKIKKVEKLIYISFLISKTFITYFLKKGYVNLLLFDYFKLGTLIVEKRRSEKIKNQIKE